MKTKLFFGALALLTFLSVLRTEQLLVRAQHQRDQLYPAQYGRSAIIQLSSSQPKPTATPSQGTCQVTQRTTRNPDRNTLDKILHALGLDHQD